MRLRLRLWVSLEDLTCAVAHDCILLRIYEIRIVALHVSTRWKFIMVSISATVEGFWRRWRGRVYR